MGGHGASKKLKMDSKPLLKPLLKPFFNPLLFSVLFLSAVFWGCGHKLEDGDYQLVRQHILKDDCGLAEEPGLFAVGHLRTTGELVFWGYDFFEIQLVGFYLSDTERWRADGNVANISWEMGGTACKLDEIRMSMEATVKTRRSFEGVFSISTHTAKAPECVCELWAGYEAVFLEKP